MANDKPGTGPKRIQRKRTKGWKMPPNTVYVGRPTFWENPFTPEKLFDAGYSTRHPYAVKYCVDAFREWLTGVEFSLEWREPSHFVDWLKACADGRIKRIHELRGKDLACWCPLNQPCHADILLEIAND